MQGTGDTAEFQQAPSGSVLLLQKKTRVGGFRTMKIYLFECML